MFIIVNLNLMQLDNAKYFLNQSNLKGAFMPIYCEHTVMIYDSICLQVKNLEGSILLKITLSICCDFNGVFQVSCD